MHDVHRDSIISKGSRQKSRTKHQHHSHEDQHGDSHTDHHHDEEDSHHSDAAPHGHEHEHDEGAYEHHDHDGHVHPHGEEAFEDRAFAHAHEHGHNFFHVHHHTHHSEHTTLTHRIFNDPTRDWFGAALMALLILMGYLKALPGHLSDGMLVCAAVIGLFPVLKNAVFYCLANRTVNFELIVGVLLLGGLFMGWFLQVALICLFLLVGSFMKLNFAWRS